MGPRKPYRRGYAVALLVGIDNSQAVLWKVYSEVVKPEKTVNLADSRSNAKALYNFHEAVVNAMRPTIKEGVKAIVLASPPRTSYSKDFLQHIRGHHTWLMQGAEKATFAEIVGATATVHEVTALTRTPQFLQIIGDTTQQENENLLMLLEKNLNAPGPEPMVLYSLEEIEDKILGEWPPSKPKPRYLVLTDTYLSESRQRNRLQRLIQIAANRKVKARIVKADTLAGKRLLQLGGIICILKPD